MSSPGIRLKTQESPQSKAKLQVLLVEDDPVDVELVLRELRRDGFEVAGAVVRTADEFRQRVKEGSLDIILADYNLGEWRGVETLKILRDEGLDIPVIMVTGALGDVAAVECIKQGATDYVLKDGLARLPEAIRRALWERCERSLRQKAERDLARKVDELGRSNADLEQFAYVASHDLQEPLRMVVAYTQLLSERYRGKLDETADTFLGYANDGARRMQVLVQDVLAFSRVGRQDAVRGSVDCDAVMERVVQALGPGIRESGAVLNLARLPAVWADRNHVAQMFQNLIGNAIKFRGKEPLVLSVQAEKAGADWLFSVSDNGIGIASEHLETVFKVFQRLHGRTEYPGNGIGLAICKKIAEVYGGKIWAESEAGKGSTFKFTMPSSGPEESVGAQP
jgi:signal transduction histidine kinase